jgi:8-oxo-dGTP diphosphatase
VLYGGSAQVADGLPRVGSALIVKDKDNRILLGKRNKDPQRGNWVLPGGKIHAFESIADAAARELAEETGLVVEVQHQFRVYEVINPPNEHRIVIYSWAKVVSGNLQASDDISEVKFVSISELGDLALTPLVREVLADAGYIDDTLLTHAEPADSAALDLFPLPVVAAVKRRPAAVHRSQVPRRRPRLSGPSHLQTFLRFESAILE